MCRRRPRRRKRVLFPLEIVYDPSRPGKRDCPGSLVVAYAYVGIVEKSGIVFAVGVYGKLGKKRGFGLVSGVRSSCSTSSQRDIRT